MSNRRVVVTGLGLITPVGNDVETAWNAIKNGQSGINKIEHFDASSFSTQFGGSVKGFDTNDYMPSKEARRMDTFMHYGIAAGIQAVQDAGLDESNFVPERSGVAVGSGIGGIAAIENTTVTIQKSGPRKVSPFFVPGSIINMIGGTLSIRFGLKGPNIAVTTACTTGTHNIGLAANMIENNQADIMVAGGAEMATTPVGLGGFCAARALSSRNDDPQKASRPWDKDRDGFVLSDGAGIMVLEEYEHAKQRGAKIYAELVGFGMSGDAYHMTSPSVGGAGAAQWRSRELPGPGGATADSRVGHHGCRRPGVYHHSVVDLHLSRPGHRDPGHGLQPAGRRCGADPGGPLMSLLQVRDLSVIANNAGHDVTLVDRVSFDLAEGEILGLVGESGSGKTMACRGLIRLLPSPNLRVQGGAVRLAGQDLLAMGEADMRAVRGGQLGMIFQNPSSHLDPLMRIGEQIAEGIRLHQGASKKDARRQAVEVLRQVGIPDPQARVDNYPHEFSGGMRQRVMIAMALITRPEILIADEPTTALDVTVQKQVLDLIKDRQEKLGTAVILVTHDLAVVSQSCDQVNVMYAGRIVESAASDDLFAHPRHAYTRALLKSIPSTHEKGDKLYTIPGLPPNLSEPPKSCSFQERNTLGDASKCLINEAPQLFEVAPEHQVQNCPGCLA